MSLDSVIRELREFDTALLANTIGYIDSTPAEEFYMAGSIQSVTRSLGPTVGVAVTCEMDTSSPGGDANMGVFWDQVDRINAMEESAVWVVKAVGSRPDHECVLGDGMAKGLYAAGCIAAVSDGGLRDVAGLLSIPFAAYCKGITIHHCALRLKTVDQPIELGGIVVRPGDVIHADSEGVIRIPPSCLDTLAEAAVRMRAFEAEAHFIMRRTDLIPSEKPKMTKEVLAKYGFA